MKIIIDSQKKMQKIEGWGTSLCWWANVLGTWKNEKKINQISDLLFDDVKGLGMNIIRYNIGGGENPPNKKNLRFGADIPCYQSGPDEWNMDADAGQRKFLFKARDRGVDIFEAFSNAPPVWMTKNRSSAGAKDRRNNLKDDMYGDFAEFMTEVIKYFKENFDLVFNSLSPFNEPISCWWHSDNDQEGCFFDTDKQMEIIRETAERLRKKDLLQTTIAAPEGWSVFDSIYSYGCYSDEIKSCVSQLNTHAYSGDKKSRLFLKSIAKKDNKKLWMSEVSYGGINPHNHSDMDSALDLAGNIHDYLNEMNSTAWIYWQAVEDEEGKHNHGLIHADFKGSEEFWITRQYYAFSNYSKFIKKNFTIIESTSSNIVSAYNKQLQVLIIVAINRENTVEDCTFDLSSFDFKDSKVEVFRTSVSENLARLKDEHIKDCKLRIKLKEISVTTFSIREGT